MSLAALSHRGPDGEGEFASGTVWLAHRRLAIIDTGASGAQPMTIEGSGTIVFNGEIYDYLDQRRRLESRGIRFTTSSDTEVLLRALAVDGMQALRHVHGMFAFAWLEPGGRRLWLARDHAGMKPLYYWAAPHGFAFASEIRSIAVAVQALGGDIRCDGEAVSRFLMSGSVPEPQTVLRSVRMLPRDSFVCVDVDRASVSVPQQIGRRINLNEEVVEPQYPEATFDAVVRRHLVADIPVALFLSGGIDSGLLALLASRTEVKPTAISVTLGSRGTDDEPELVRKLAARCDLKLEQVPIDNWRVRLESALQHYDLPSIDGLNTYLIAGIARDLGFKVALSGVGADEVFGGYKHLRLPYFRLAHTAAGRRVGERVEGALSRSRLRQVRRIGHVLDAIADGDPPQFGVRRLLGRGFIRTLFPGLPDSHLSAPRAVDQLEFEQATYLQNTLLRDSDVMGMAQGVEVRAPYLDPAVLALGRRIGTHNLVDKRRPTKWPLREAWTSVSSQRAPSRNKTGFTLKLSDWLRNQGLEQLEAARAGLERRQCVNVPALRNAWKRWAADLETDHPAAWVPLFAMMQVEQQFTRWGEP